ncbi:MAG: hypothetical protein RI911_791 [Candidatus Parcubacteria bacterium]|jgi:predicted 3-demethylubiquinone-9 3-methyltransferase (glyoxalase superfamily)
MQRITPFLWCDTQAEEAAQFYTKLFPNSCIVAKTRYPEGTPELAGSVMTVEFILNSHRFVALNGGPTYTMTPGTSFVIDCKDQAEIDHFWNAFKEGGKEMQCGWITDRFGVTWQVIPSMLSIYLGDKNAARAGRVAAAMMQMLKMDCAALEKAYNQ